LSLRERDRSFFHSYVQREDGFKKLLELSDNLSDSQENIQNNARMFDERLRSLPEDERPRLAQFIVTRCYLVAVATPDLDSAYRIFSVLNSRGLDLSATDILKAEIIGGIAEAQREGYTTKWENTEEDLGRNSFGDLFSHIRMAYRKAKPQGTLLREFREHVTKNSAPDRFIDEILIPMADVYEELTDSAYASPERAESVNESLKWLNRLEFKDWVPPALAFAVRKRNSPEKMESFFKDLERLSYWMLVTRAGINERIDRYSRLTRAIEQEENLQATDSLLQLTKNEQWDIYAVLDGPIYDRLSARARSAVLLRLDALMSGGGAQYDYDTITVEHVLPQNPDAKSEWTSWFPDAAERVSLVHRLGNLALLTRKKNSSASNYEFGRKKSAYFTQGGISPFVLTTQVLKHDIWDPDVIQQRQSELMKKLEAHWRLEERKDPQEAFLE
jgi:hypothetical protein